MIVRQISEVQSPVSITCVDLSSAPPVPVQTSLRAGGREAPPPPPYRTHGSPSLSSDPPTRGKPPPPPTRTPAAPPPPPPPLRNGHSSSVPRSFVGESVSSRRSMKLLLISSDDLIRAEFVSSLLCPPPVSPLFSFYL